MSRNQDQTQIKRSGPLTVSVLIHGILLLICITGLPFIKRELPDLAEPISVDIVTVAETRQTNKAPAKSEAQKTQKAPEKEPDKPPPPKPATPQATTPTPPKPVAPEKPEPKDIVKVPDEKKAETPKPEQPKDKPKPAERKPMLTQEQEKAQEEDFQSVLKNLMPAEATKTETSQATTEGAEPSPLAQMGEQLTMSEMDLLRQQLSQCWNLLAGARYAEDLVVDIKLFMNPDRTIRDAQIVDIMRYNADSYFRAAADGALRAVRNPQCNPLHLPEGKYSQWKTITVTFDPREML